MTIFQTRERGCCLDMNQHHIKKFILSILLFINPWHSIGQEKFINEEFSIIEGVGYESISLDSLRFEDLDKIMDEEFKIITHGEFSIEVYYEDLGISFYYYQDDIEKSIFGINFKHPFDGTTTKGIKLNGSTMSQVVEAYGEPDWSGCDNCNHWTADYQGIEFTVMRDMSLPHYPLDEEVHLKKIITEIFIFNEDLFN